MSNFQKQILISAGIVAVVLIIVFFAYRNLQPQITNPNVNLTMWGFDPPSIFGNFIGSYHNSHQNVSINYEQVDEQNYEDKLLNALAAGQGPDIFLLHNRSLPKEIEKLSPVSPAQFNLNNLRDFFPEVAEEDFASVSGTTKEIYALPLSIDTLAMIYNKDLLDKAGIASPPKTWQEFQNIVPALRSLSQSGQIVQAAAIGGSGKTIGNVADILSLLMLQNGSRMVSEDLGRAVFASEAGNPGPGAFNFYLQFANPASPYYTWNDNQPSALESFIAGNTAIIFDYHSALEKIKSKSPFLNFGVAQVPQVESPTPASLPAQAGASARGYANYWGFAVSKQAKYPAEAWDFVIYLATDETRAATYLRATNQPPALRSLIGQYLSDPEFGVFTRSALIARSWRQADEKAIDGIFSRAVSGVLNGEFDSSKALRQAQDQITQLMNQ